MQKLVDELKTLMSFKDSTTTGDIVLVASKVPQMLLFGYVTAIERDMTRKDEWWHVEFSLLSIPIQKITWTLRTEQMTGMEIFTMGGEERFVKAIDIDSDSVQVIPTPTVTEKKSAKTRLKRIK